MPGQTDKYRLEILNFLRTVTIKFTPFAYMMGEAYMDEHGLEDPHGTWNPYYQNLAGQYSDTDEQMMVYSVEEETNVPYNRELFTKYPKTASSYKVGTTEFKNLEDKYPKNRGLIKSIAYPVDINEAIKAKNLTVLGYDDSYLESTERESIVNRLKSFIDEVRVRWWVDEYTYENMYAITFWAMLWQLLPAVLLTQRFDNIKTDAVHSYHIWEYLKSKGLNDYRDVLTNKQAHWLYRNIDYLQKNKGKNSNLPKLADNLLDKVAVSLTYKDMIQTIDSPDGTSTTPTFITKNLTTGEKTQEESFPELNDRLKDQGLSDLDTTEKVNKKETDLSHNNYNELPTKFLELKKDVIDTSNLQIMIYSFMDTLMYRLNQNKLAYKLEVKDPMSGGHLKLAVQDVVILWYYALHKSVGNNPVYIPNQYICHLAYKEDRPDLEEFDKSVTADGVSYTLGQLINIKAILKAVRWTHETFTSVEDFAELLANHYACLVYTDRRINMSSKLHYHLAMKIFESIVCIKRVFHLNLTNEILYSDWITKTTGVATLANSIDEQAKDTVNETWEIVAENCYDALFPVTADLSDLVATPRSVDKIYTAVKDLFISLCSYNVEFLESTRNTFEYIKVPEADYAFNIGKEIIFDSGSSSDGYVRNNPFDINIESPVHTAINDEVHEPKLPSFSTEVEIDNEIDSSQKIDITTDVNITRTDEWSNTKKILTQVFTHPTETVYNIQFKTDLHFN